MMPEPLTLKVQILRTSGAIESHEIPNIVGQLFPAICKLIGATTLDTVNLRDGRVMLVDDNGYETTAVEHSPNHVELRPVRALRPLNPEATKLYLAICRPGTTHQIVGDVAIVNRFT